MAPTKAKQPPPTNPETWNEVRVELVDLEARPENPSPSNQALLQRIQSLEKKLDDHIAKCTSEQEKDRYLAQDKEFVEYVTARERAGKAEYDKCMDVLEKFEKSSKELKEWKGYPLKLQLSVCLAFALLIRLVVDHHLTKDSLACLVFVSLAEIFSSMHCIMKYVEVARTLKRFKRKDSLNGLKTILADDRVTNVQTTAIVNRACEVLTTDKFNWRDVIPTGIFNCLLLFCQFHIIPLLPPLKLGLTFAMLTPFVLMASISMIMTSFMLGEMIIELNQWIAQNKGYFSELRDKKKD